MKKEIKAKMTYSQINPIEIGGFSRRSPNLKISPEGRLKPKSIRGLPLIQRNPINRNHLLKWRWFQCQNQDSNISIQKNTRLKARLQVLKKDFIASITSIITLSGFQNIGSVYLQERLRWY
jgi:hypothetical protein